MDQQHTALRDAAPDLQTERDAEEETIDTGCRKQEKWADQSVCPLSYEYV